ncbi:protochlorophyllide-dependent translocon component 52, chloroplastic-like isoform X2 [Phalaenopsis equestris]|uniref:protochlorophyllide-dependent translocon component 52, chloroplastic-like isoform X2 n=1 Tax=Phalaenopsis equestris TaxID=78828 RepID=UPI0009E1F94D|nr:protochlorophyllide-dependent translocon component 52, chloroplastic-like isoform X2 [Phalaenopsis equestris]
MDAITTTSVLYSNFVLLSSKPYPSLRSHLRWYTPSSSHVSRQNLKLNVSTFDSTSVAVPAADTLSAGGNFGEKFDWYAHWYPVAPVRDLDKRAPRAVRVLGIDLVVWWDREGDQWRVFDDRCPHRLAPLSEGRIDSWGRLQCVYHGWCFDGAGSCKIIPQAPENGPQVHTSSKACATSYPCCVQNKILWFWPRSEPQHKDILSKSKPPSVSELDDLSYTCNMGMRDMPYGYEVLIENLMDPAHVPYAHHKILRIPERPPSLTRDREGGIPLDITIEKFHINGYLAKQQFGYGKFVAPCLYYSSPPSGSSNGSVSSSNSQTMPTHSFLKRQRRALLVFFCIPVSPGRSRERKIAEIGPSNWQKACFVPTKSDAKVTAFRKWLRRYSNSQIHWPNKFGNFLPPTPPKEQLLDRYWSHVVHCSSCSLALKRLRILEFSLPVVSVALIGLVAAAKQEVMLLSTRTALVAMALVCFAASRWLSHFIYKTFYFHDYNHAFV